MEPGPYQVRYVWDRRIWTVVCAAVAVILIVLNLPMPWLPAIALTGGGLLVVLGCLLYCRVAQYAPHVGVRDADTGREITADG